MQRITPTKAACHSLEPPDRCSGAASHSKDAEKPRPKQSQPEGELQLLPNRRFFLAGLGSLTIGVKHSQPYSTCNIMTATACHAAAVLVSNLGGATGFLLGLDGGQTANKLKIDSIFPVQGLKRCINYQQRFGEMHLLNRLSMSLHHRQPSSEPTCLCCCCFCCRVPVSW